MTTSSKSPAERQQAQVLRTQAFQERQQNADTAKADHRKALLARDEKTERLRSQRLAAEAALETPSASTKRTKRTLRPGQTPKTRRAITG